MSAAATGSTLRKLMNDELLNRATEKLKSAANVLIWSFPFSCIGHPSHFALPKTGQAGYATYEVHVELANKEPHEVMEEIHARLDDIMNVVLLQRNMLQDAGEKDIHLVWRLNGYFVAGVETDYSQKGSPSYFKARTRIALTTAAQRKIEEEAADPGEQDELAARRLDVVPAKLYTDAQITEMCEKRWQDGDLHAHGCYLPVPWTPFYIERDHWLLRAWRRVFG